MSAELVAVPVTDELFVLDDSEAAADLTADEAEAITSRIRTWANSFPADDVVRAFRGRIWVALAYDSWAEWCECELGGLKLPVPQRREVVAELAGAGMSNPAIADAIGVDQSTVYRDKQATGFASANPVTGQDGKEYTPPQPKPPPQREPEEVVDAEIVDAPPLKPTTPKRRPLPDVARDLGIDIDKIADRIERFRTDDRLGRNKNEVAARLRYHLGHLIDVCQDLDQHLT